MAEIKVDYGSGGVPIAPTGVDSQAPLATVLRDVADDLGDLMGTKTDGSGVVEGGYVKDPTTGSTQATGAAGATVWNVDHTALLAEVAGVFGEIAAATDYVIHDTTIVHADFQVGKSIVAALVLKNNSGTITVDKVVGTPADTGSEVAPTDAEIDTAMTGMDGWARLCDCTLNRTADTTVTQSQDWTVRDRSTGRGATAGRRTIKG
jgi:hypothetical protein